MIYKNLNFLSLSTFPFLEGQDFSETLLIAAINYLVENCYAGVGSITITNYNNYHKGQLFIRSV